MEPSKNGGGPQRKYKYMGRFAVPLQSHKMTASENMPSHLPQPFKKPVLKSAVEPVKKQRISDPIIEDCLMGDSFCDNEILEDLCKIEAQYSDNQASNHSPGSPSTSKTRQKVVEADVSKGRSNSSVVSGLQSSNSNKRKSPRRQDVHKKHGTSGSISIEGTNTGNENIVQHDCMNGKISPKQQSFVSRAPKFKSNGESRSRKSNGDKDTSDFVPIGSDTLEAIDAMNFDNLEFPDEILSPGDKQDQNAQPSKVCITPLLCHRKRRVLSDSHTPNLRRSQRLRVKKTKSNSVGETSNDCPQIRQECDNVPKQEFSLKSGKRKCDGQTPVKQLQKKDTSIWPNASKGSIFNDVSEELFDDIDEEIQLNAPVYVEENKPKCDKKEVAEVDEILSHVDKKTKVDSLALRSEPKFIKKPVCRIKNGKDLQVSTSSNSKVEGICTEKNSFSPKDSNVRDSVPANVSSRSAQNNARSPPISSIKPRTFTPEPVEDVSKKVFNDAKILNHEMKKRDGNNLKEAVTPRETKRKALKASLSNVEHKMQVNTNGYSNIHKPSTANRGTTPVKDSETPLRQKESCNSIRESKEDDLTVPKTNLLIVNGKNPVELLSSEKGNVGECSVDAIEQNVLSKKSLTLLKSSECVSDGLVNDTVKVHSLNSVDHSLNPVDNSIHSNDKSADLYDSSALNGTDDNLKNIQVLTCDESAPNQHRKSNLDLSTNISKNECSVLSTQAKMELSSWGLPDAVLQRYIQNGIKTMFPWQAECLSLPSVLDGKNLVYSAPTSAGKTLVAELLLLKRVLETGRKGVYILPFVSVAREKMYYLQKMFAPAGIRVEGFMGSHGPRGGMKVTDVAVCTIEKANNLVNRLLEEKRLHELGIIVVDEVHMLGDSHRGYLLELLLTKIMYVCQATDLVCQATDLDNQSESRPEVQIVGMSATLPNLDLLSSWLDSQLYSTDYRPVPLAERVKIGTAVFDAQMKKIRNLDPVLTVKGDSDHLIQLCLETVLEGLSVLVFCPTKAWCEKLAESVAKEFFSIGKPDSRYAEHIGVGLRESLNSDGIGRVLEALRKCPVGLDKVLGRSVAFGSAYHHAGLTFDERDIIEGGFRNGSIRVLVATSTLSSGVNLPARRVIIRSPVFGGSILDTLTYKQMIGRAGRKGVDTEGESILICRDGERPKAQTLMTSSLPPITSCLQQDSSLTSSMKRAILEVIVSGVAAGPTEVERYCSCTLLAASLKDSTDSSQSGTHNSILSCVQFLEENEFIRLQEGENGTKYIGTQLGCAVLASGLSPDEGLHVFTELHRARQCFVLENELHLIYQVTPVYVSSAWPSMDWLNFLNIWEGLPADMKRVADLVGVQECFIIRAVKGIVNRKIRQQAKLLAVHQRFYTALALHELVQEVPLNVVAQKYSATRGMLQSLQQSAATFAGMVTVFCNRLGWHNLELLVAQFHERLHFGIQRELCDLVRLSCLNGQRARYLYNAGLETVSMVAHSSKDDIENILCSATPFQSNKVDGKECSSGGTIWLSSGQPLTEAQVAALILEEARRLVQKELGLASIDWNQRDKVITTPNRRLLSHRRGSSSAKRNSTIRRKNSTSPNPILRSESALSRINVSSEILKTSNISYSTPLRGKRKSPCSVASSGHKFKSPKLIDNRQDLADKSFGSKSTVNNIKKSPVIEHLKEISKNPVSIEDNESGNKDVSVSNKGKSIPDHSIGNKENVDCFQNNNGAVPFDHNKSKSSEVEPRRRERKDTKIRPKNSSWKEESTKETNESREKENIIPNDNDCSTNKLENESSLESPLFCILKGGASAKKTSLGSILFRKKGPMKGINNNSESNNNGESNNYSESDKTESFHVPESQEDKSDNVFSPKRKLETRNSKKGTVKDVNADSLKNLPKSSNQTATKVHDGHTPELNRVLFSKSGEKKGETDCSEKSGPDQQSNDLEVVEGSHMSNPAIHSKEKLSVKTSTPFPNKLNSVVCSDSTPITDSTAKFCADDSFQGNRNSFEISFSSSIRDPPELVNRERSNNAENAETRKCDPQKNSSLGNLSKPFEAGMETLNVDGVKAIQKVSVDVVSGMDILTESQREAFMITMNSQDFNDLEPFKDVEPVGDQEEEDTEEPVEDPCFGIDCSKREDHESFLHPEAGEQMLNLSPLEVLSSEKLQKEAYALKLDDEAAIPSSSSFLAIENLSWGEAFDSYNELRLEENGNNSKNESLNFDVSYTEISKPKKGQQYSKKESRSIDRSPSHNESEEYLMPLDLEKNVWFDDSGMENVEGDDQNLAETNKFAAEAVDSASPHNRSSGDDLPPMDLEQNICVSQNTESVPGKCGNDETLSDSFFEKAFETYLHNSPRHTNVTSAKPSKLKTNEKNMFDDIKDMVERKERNALQTGKHNENVKAVEVKQQSTNTNRLSDDLFSPAVSPTHRSVCKDVPKDDLPQNSPSFRTNDSENAKLKPSVTEKGSMSKPSTSALPKSHSHSSAHTAVASTSVLPKSPNYTSDYSSIASNSFCIIDVVGNSDVFECFLKEWKEQKRFSISLACEKPPSQPSKGGGIGWRITGHSRTPRRNQLKEVTGLVIENSDLLIVGMAVCWGGQDAYYINLRMTQEDNISCSLPTPPICETVLYDKRISSIKEALSNAQLRDFVLCTWDAKAFAKLVGAAGIEISSAKFEDPRIASWMLDPGSKEQNIFNLVMSYNAQCLPLLECLGSSWGLSSLGVNTDNPGSCRVRAATESVVVFHLINALKVQLEEVDMLQSFVNVEMPSAVVLAYLELNGMGFSNQDCEKQKAVMQAKLTSLEQEVYSMVGHPFSLTSPDEISQVLYGELHLPIPPGHGTASRGGRGRGIRGARGSHRISGPTNKDALEKLEKLHPLPSLILQWRKINASLTKVVFPLQHERVHNAHLGMDRIHPRTHIFTATGRVTVHDPNLQAIPRDFNIQKAVDQNIVHINRRQKQQRALSNSAIMDQLAPLLTNENEEHTVSLRHALVAHSGNILLAADYSQLELRLLAHLASDRKLIDLLNSGEDVFKMIAAQIHMADIAEVTSEWRQQAKQICYGMIYGMGAKALGDQLGIDENEAFSFMEKFKSRFKGIQAFMQTTVESCREKGFVVTLMGRRRYLPNITSANSFAKSQSERQAINTAIQGSAADLVKLAMVEIERTLRATFPSSLCYFAQLKRPHKDFSGAFLVLQLHDELIYEVASEDVIQVAQLVQSHMEGAQQLTVRLPVKIKVGASWGAMQTLNL